MQPEYILGGEHTKKKKCTSVWRQSVQVYCFPRYIICLFILLIIFKEI